jgi:cell division protease FtsH
MSSKLGPLTYGRRQRLQYLGVEGTEERNFSEETARSIDVEVRSLIEEAQSRAREILSGRRASLDALASALQEREVLDRMQVERVVRESSEPGQSRQGLAESPTVGP